MLVGGGAVAERRGELLRVESELLRVEEVALGVGPVGLRVGLSAHHEALPVRRAAGGRERWRLGGLAAVLEDAADAGGVVHDGVEVELAAAASAEHRVVAKALPQQLRSRPSAAAS